MFFVIDAGQVPQLQTVFGSAATESVDTRFVRLVASEGHLTVSAADRQTTIPATTLEPGVLFVRLDTLKGLLEPAQGGPHFTLRVTDTGLQVGPREVAVQESTVKHFPDPQIAPPRWPLSPGESREWSIRSEYQWAVDIVLHHFNHGLERICGEAFLTRRYSDFQRKQDPIYSELLGGMEDEALAKTFVSYWTIGQTMATQSRFWLETAVAELLVRKYQQRDRPEECYVLHQGHLRSGSLNEPVSVAEMGEDHLEHLSSSQVWRVNVDTRVLETIDVLVGQQERERVDERKPFQKRTWTDEQNQHAREMDERHMAEVATSFAGTGATEVNMQCNLLVIEPYKVDNQPHAWAFRFVNPKTISSHPQRKQERVNLLRLHALLVQEKIVRAPQSISTCVGELIPRLTEFDDLDRYPDYFSPHTYWTTQRVWDFIGVPFDVVSLAIRDAAKNFRDRLIKGLRGLLPENNEDA